MTTPFAERPPTEVELPITRVHPLIRLMVVVVLTGIGAGLSGMSLALLLRAVQHISYGYSLDVLVGTQSFLQGVSGASPVRRVAMNVQFDIPGMPPSGEGPAPRAAA